MIRPILHTALKLLRATVGALNAADFLRMAGATAFFASFALPAILMIIVRILSLFLDRRELILRLRTQLLTLFGPESTESIGQTIRSFRGLQQNYLVTGGLGLFLLFVATTLFRVIKNSINELWHIRKLREKQLATGLRSRALSVVVMLLAGLLFLVVQVIDSGRHLLGRYLFGDVQSLIAPGQALSLLVVVALSALWFYVLFMWLPDGRPDRRTGVLGALITGILFNAGKWVLQGVLRPEQVSHFYGASGAVVLVLLFVFYSAIILYAGAAFVKVWSEHKGRPIRLKAHTVRYRLEEEPEG